VTISSESWRSDIAEVAKSELFSELPGELLGSGQTGLLVALDSGLSSALDDGLPDDVSMLSICDLGQIEMLFIVAIAVMVLDW